MCSAMFRLSPLSALVYPEDVPKALTRDRLEARKEKAVRFVRDVLDDPDRADEIEDESVDDYAARRRIDIVDNPRRRRNAMPQGRTKADLEAEIEELREENEELQDQLDAVADIVAPADEDEEEDGEDDDQGEE